MIEAFWMTFGAAMGIGVALLAVIVATMLVAAAVDLIEHAISTMGGKKK